METTQIDSLYSYWGADKENSFIATDIIRVHSKNGELDLAREFFEQLSPSVKTSRRVMGVYAHVLIASHKFELAEKLLAQLLNSDPHNANLIHDLGLCLFAQNKPKECVELIDANIEKAKEFPELLVLMARSSRLIAPPSKSIGYLRGYLSKSETQDNEALSLLCLLLCDQGQFEEALGLAEKILSEDKTKIEAISAASTSALNLKRYSRALYWLSHGLTLYPKAYGLWREKGALELSTAAPHSAIESFKTAQRLHPDKRTLYLIGISYLLLEKYQEAIEHFEQINEEDVIKSDALAGIELCKIMQTDFYCIEDIEQIIKTNNTLGPLTLIAKILVETKALVSSQNELNRDFNFSEKLAVELEKLVSKLSKPFH